MIAEILIGIASSNLFFANSAISIILEIIQRYGKDHSLNHQFGLIFKLQINSIEDGERQKIKS